MMDGQSQSLPNSRHPSEASEHPSPSHGDSKVSLLQRASRFRAGIKKRHGSSVGSRDIPDSEINDAALMRSKSVPSSNNSKNASSSPDNSNPDLMLNKAEDLSPNELESGPNKVELIPSQVGSNQNRLESCSSTAESSPVHKISSNENGEFNDKSNRDSTGSSLSEFLASAKAFEGHHNFNKQGQTQDDLEQSECDITYTTIARAVSTISTMSTISGISVGSGSDVSVFEDAASTPTTNPSISASGDPQQMTLDAPLSRALHDNAEDSTNEPESWNVDDAIEGTAQLLGTAGGYFFSVLGQVASSAFSLTQSAVKYLVNYNRVETWHDCDSDEDYDAFQDAAEDLTPQDRVYHICNELLTTEEAYVERLGLLVKAKDKAAKILNPEVANQMFKDIEVIWEFHRDNLLPQLTDRMKKWLQYEKIGDVMRKLTPFLKLYTEYVKDFQRATALVDSYEEKSSSFASALRNLRENSKSPVNRKLNIQAHMMEPIQRVPRYELLLRDYIKHIPADSADREDAEEALKYVAEAAVHFEEMIKRDSRIGKLMQIQSKLDGCVNVVQPERELVKEGLLEKVPRKNFSDKYIFLFNDMMLICNRVKLVVTKYKVKHVLNLSDVRVVRGLNLDSPSSFAILCPKKEIDLIDSSIEETNAWFEMIKHTIKEHRSSIDQQLNDKSDMPNSPMLNGDVTHEDGNPEVLWQDYIHISPDEGKSWRKRWVVLKSDRIIRFYKSNSEDEETSYLDTCLFEKCYLINTPTRKGHSVCLTSAFHKYLLCGDNEDIIDSLYLTMTGQSPDHAEKPEL